MYASALLYWFSEQKACSTAANQEKIFPDNILSKKNFIKNPIFNFAIIVCVKIVLKETFNII